MRININLASNPYEAAREYTRRMGMLVAALAVIFVGLLGYILYQRSHNRGVNQEIEQAQQEIASLNAEKAKALATLNQPQNRQIADQSQFLNNLFARKALSWTRVFTELERMMPPNIHVISMKPEFNHENQLVLHVVVATSVRDKAVELVKSMEKSPHFHSPQVAAETTLAESAAGGNIQFDIAAVYVPFVDDSDAAADEKADAKPDEKPAAKPNVKPEAKTGGKSAANKGGGKGPGGGR